MNKYYVKVAIRVLISLILVAVLFAQIDTEQVFLVLAHLSPVVIIGAIILYAIVLFFGALKWHLLLPECSLSRLFRATFVGQFYSFILPGQLFGEVAKIYRTAKDNNAENVAASVWVDRMTGLIGLLIVGLVGIGFSDASLPTGVFVAITGLILGAFLMLHVMRLPFFGVFISQASTSLIPRRLSGIKESVLLFIKYWNIYSGRNLTIIINIVFGIFLQLGSIFMVKIIANDIGINVSVVDLAWIFAVVSVALLLPITIGGLGLRDGVLGATLIWLGNVPESALALSLSLFMLQAFAAFIGAISEVLSALYARRT